MNVSGGKFIVTGATGGIGRAITLTLVEKGASVVVLACRDAEKCRKMMAEISHGNTLLEMIPLDLASFASVRKFVAKCGDTYPKIDGIFNNAGTMPATARVTIDGYEEATQTNFLSTALLTRLLLPLMNKSGSIVFTTSMTRHIVKLRNDWESRAITHHGRFTTYGRSKLMLTHFALDLARELAPLGISVNCSDPGVVDSAIITMGNNIVDHLADMIVRPVISTPRQGAAPAIAAMESSQSGLIFTLHNRRPIPTKFLRNPLHSLPSKVIARLLD